MNKNDRALLLGMLLGDGCLKAKPHILQDGSKTFYYEYVLCHSTKQEDYLTYKRDLFHSIVGGKLPRLSYHNGKLGNSVRFSRCHRSFRFLHRHLYAKNFTKTITRRVLNCLTPEAIAIWFMDDGGLKPSYNRLGQISSCQTTLSTYCSAEQADIIIDYFREVWNIEWKRRLHKKSNSYYLILSTTEGKKFERLVSPHIIPSMSYKILSNRVTRVPDTLPEKKGDDMI